jgi:hypothetical protein
MHFIFLSSNHIEQIKEYIRGRKIQKVLLLSNISEEEKNSIINLCAIYAINFAYPKILPEVY